MMIKNLLGVISASVFLSACGGGGGGSSDSGSGSNGTSPTQPVVQKGVFVDSPVAGLRYETDTREGLTNALGEYEYIEGEMIKFSIGGIKLGQALASEQTTPFSLFGIIPPANEARIAEALGDLAYVRSLDKALNVAQLLQNLDSDGNPDNGIDIADADAVLADSTLNIQSFKAANFLTQANIGALKAKLELSTPTRTLSQAAEHLYDSLDVQVKAAQVQGLSSSNAAQKQNTTYQYDDQGRLIREDVDTDANGQTDYSILYSYSNGQLTQIENTRDSSIQTLSYNQDGKITSRATQNSSAPNTRETSVYSNGELIEFSFDADDDGTPEKVTRYTYDTQGNQLTYSADSDGDGNIDSLVSYSYNSNNQVVTFSEDKDNDGTPNLVIAYTYDADGNRSSYNITVNNNGSPESLSNFEFFPGGKVKTYKTLDPQDGSLEYQETYKYNQKGQRTSYKRDLNGDGSWDKIAQYEYDENGQRISVIEDTDGNGIADKVWRGDFQTATLQNPWDLILSKL
jgi:YD repeat-containing protein